MAKQLTIFVYLRVRPEDADNLIEAHKPVWAACAAEPEFCFFDVSKIRQTEDASALWKYGASPESGSSRSKFTKPYNERAWER
jgi:hypothetical protein